MTKNKFKILLMFFFCLIFGSWSRTLCMDSLPKDILQEILSFSITNGTQEDDNLERNKDKKKYYQNGFSFENLENISRVCKEWSEISKSTGFLKFCQLGWVINASDSLKLKQRIYYSKKSIANFIFHGPGINLRL